MPTIHRQVQLGHLKISDRAKGYVAEALANNRLSAGPFTAAFESQFAACHQCHRAIFLNSGTSALQVALSILKEKHGYAPGDEVLVPAVTFVATANIVLHCGLQPVFVDVNPETFNIDLDDLQASVTKRTRCIIPVHLFGLPCAMAQIMGLAAKHRLQVLEDSCQAMFVGQNRRSVGAFGDFAAFSTYVAHILTTGVGGLITTQNAEDAKLCRSSMAHGRDTAYLNIDDDADASGDELRSIIQRRFSFVRLGHNFRLTELEAALGLAALEDRDMIMSKRRTIGEAYRQRLLGRDDLRLQKMPGDSTCAFMFCPFLVLRGNRDDLALHLEEHGVETRYMMPLINQPIYRQLFGNLEARHPVASEINAKGLCVPSHDGMAIEDVHYVCDLITQYLRHV